MRNLLKNSAFLKISAVALMWIFTSCSGGGSGNGDIANGTMGLAIQVVEGNNQSVRPGVEYPKQLTVSVKSNDSKASPIANTKVSFAELTSTGALISTPTVMTDENGMASVHVT